jgi:hypothetical protein
LDPAKLYLSSPYWGGEAAQFAWNMAVLPDASENYERFGAADGEAIALGRTVELLGGPKPTSIVENARQDFPAAVELLYGATLAGVATEEEAREIATSYVEAVKYAEANPAPAWLENANDENFADLLSSEVHASEGERFGGGGGLLDQLKEGLSRLANALPSAGTDIALRLARKKLNATVTKFTGDAFVYLSKRGTREAPGPIVKIVLDELRKAAAASNDSDKNLVVIAHSFGGEIVYDILTHFATDIKVDCLITVGSQVGLFEEMKLYLASSPDIPKDPPKGKVPKPPNLKRWLNVFDTNDPVSYRLKPVFSGVEDDYLFETGYGGLQAHGGYFFRPSFYMRLAERLTAEPKDQEP